MLFIVPHERHEEVRQDGSRIDISVTLSRIKNAQGRITAFHVSLCQSKSTSFPYARWRAHPSFGQDR